MSEGIPIPQARHPYYCGNCGGHHAPGLCTSPPKKRTATDEFRDSDRFALLERVDGQAAEAALRNSLRETDDHVQELTERILALEAARKDKKR